MLRGGPFHNVPNVVSTTVAIRPTADGPLYKVTKLVGYKQGGLALLAPYHSARSGVLTKTLYDYREAQPRQGLAETELFSAGDRVKLSYHPDGLVQFSGERPGRIVSGRDPRSGEPRGLGIMANPMDAPVMTGPSFGILLWGLEDFVVQEGRPRGDLLVFEDRDFVYEHCTEQDWGSYHISFFIFTVYFQPYVRQVARTQFELPLWHNQFHAGQGRSFTFKVVRLGQQPWFLGAICFRQPAVGFDATSGWSIGSPGALSQGPIKPVLHAYYPADGWPVAEETLDYDGPNDERDERTPLFARDYAGLLKRAEAALLHRADRELPELLLVDEGVRLLAQVIESTVLMPRDLEEHAGQVRIALAVLGVLALRGARALVLLLEPGYVPEAGVVLNRMTSAVELAHLVDQDAEAGTVAEQFLAGAGLDVLDPPTWTNIAEAIAVNIEQLPELGLIQTPLGPRPGLGFAGNRQLPQAKELVVDVACLLTDLTATCAKSLLGGTAPELFVERLVALRADVARHMQAAAPSGAETVGEVERSAVSK